MYARQNNSVRQVSSTNVFGVIISSAHINSDSTDPTIMREFIANSYLAMNKTTLPQIGIDSLPSRPCIGTCPFIRARRLFNTSSSSISLDRNETNRTEVAILERGGRVQQVIRSNNQLASKFFTVFGDSSASQKRRDGIVLNYTYKHCDIIVYKDTAHQMCDVVLLISMPM